MGGECDQKSIFRNSVLKKYRFGLLLDIGQFQVAVERNGEQPNRIFIVKDTIEKWPIKTKTDEDTNEVFFSNSQWKAALGEIIFCLSKEILQQRYSPTFRSIFPYFARKNPEGFIHPYTHFVTSPPWLWQVALTYMLGLDWTITQDWQNVRILEDQIRKLKQQMGEGILAEIIGKTAELRSKLANSQNKYKEFKKTLDQFQVHPKYHDFEQEASGISRALNALANDNTIDEQLLADIKQAIEIEHEPPAEDLKRLYEEAGIALPSVSLRRFDEVKTFHESVVRNRKLYLQGELIKAQQRIQDRDKKKASLGARLSELMSILNSYGALDQYTQLQRELARYEAESKGLQQRFETAEQIEGQSAELAIKRKQLLLRLQQDYREQKEKIDKAIVKFTEISSQLYKEPAILTIKETENGPDVSIQIQGERSAGISNMQIFTFDMMLTSLLAERGIGPGFLIHDSHLFDPVDGRQVGTALMLGAKLATELGFQYIVTMNSDKLAEVEAQATFDIGKYVMSTRLTDAREDGGLFGFRFD